MPTAQEMYEAYLQAEQAVLRGQQVRLGDRWVSLPDLQWIQAGLKYWEARARAEVMSSYMTTNPPIVVNARWSSGHDEP